MADKVVVDVASGDVQTVPLTADELAQLKADAAALQQQQQAQQQAELVALQQRAADAATLLNSPAVRDTQQHRDAFARLIGVKPLGIPLTQDAAPTDIRPL